MPVRDAGRAGVRHLTARHEEGSPITTAAVPIASPGNFFEDFRVGQTLRHAVPRTITEGDQSLYIALTGDRNPLHCSAEFARSVGFRRETVNDLLTFHVVFGKSVPDVSLNAIANLGYAAVRFLRTVYPGDTLAATSEVIGRRESSTGDTGVVWVHTVGKNQRDETVLEFYRWVLVRKRTPGVTNDPDETPQLPKEVPAADLVVPGEFDFTRFDATATGGRWFWEDYAPGQRIVHPQGMTIEEAEQQIVTRLYQNTARAHFNALEMSQSRFGRRIVYGGHIISVARALAYDGLENAVAILAWNGGTHSNPTMAGDTLFAWTDVLDRIDLGRPDCGALRLRLVAVKNEDPNQTEIPLRVKDERGRDVYHPNVVLDLDYVVLMPRRGTA